MKRIAALLAVVAVATVGVVLTAGPATAGDPNSLIVNAVVNGTPAVPLVLTQDCTLNPPPDATSPGFTTSGNVFTNHDNFNLPPRTCTIAVAEAGGMVPSFACTTTGGVGGATCNPGNNSATSVAFTFTTVTITVTFDPAPPVTAPAAVEAGPDFTG